MKTKQTTLLFLAVLLMAGITQAQPVITYGSSVEVTLELNEPVTDLTGSDWNGDGYDPNTTSNRFDSDGAKANFDISGSTTSVSYGGSATTGVLSGGASDDTDPAAKIYCADRNYNTTDPQDKCIRIKPAEGTPSSGLYSKAAGQVENYFRFEFDDNGTAASNAFLEIESNGSFRCDNVSSSAEPLTLDIDYRINSGSWEDVFEYTEELYTSGASVGDFEDWGFNFAESVSISDGDYVELRFRIVGNTSSPAGARNPVLNSAYICNFEVALSSSGVLPLTGIDSIIMNNVCEANDFGNGVYSYDFRYTFNTDIVGTSNIDYYKLQIYDSANGIFQNVQSPTSINDLGYSATYHGLASVLGFSNPDFLMRVIAIDLDGNIAYQSDWVVMDGEIGDCSTLMSIPEKLPLSIARMGNVVAANKINTRNHSIHDGQITELKENSLSYQRNGNTTIVRVVNRVSEKGKINIYDLSGHLIDSAVVDSNQASAAFELPGIVGSMYFATYCSEKGALIASTKIIQ